MAKKKHEIKKIGAGVVFAWIFSIIFFVSGLGSFSYSWFRGIAFVLAGLVLFPTLNKELKERYKLELSKSLKIILVVVLLILAFSTTNQENLGQSIIPEDTKEISDILKKQVYWELVGLQDKIPFNDASYDEKIDETEKTIKDKYNLTDEEFRQIKYQGSVELWPIPEYKEPSEYQVTTSSEESDKLTMGEKNALSKAQSYLDYSAFSREGLIEQLEYEGYTYEEAKYGVDNCRADWNEQAALKAQSYLDYSAFSREGLIEQLEYEGFTREQAEYGVQAVGY